MSTINPHSHLYGVIDHGQQRSTGRHRPRLWWCPIAEAVFLPLHAAGTHGSHDEIECTSDYVVSSYIPNLNALTDSRVPTLSMPDAKVLLLSQPRARRQQQLYNAGVELERISKLAPSGSLLYLDNTATLDVEGEKTTAENVVAVIPDASILHLACHGFQDDLDPLDSGFAMRDGDRLTVLQLMQLNVPHAFFAFLSACHSASGSEDVPDETIGLASTMLFVGFKSVVGTMWYVRDFFILSIDWNVLQGNGRCRWPRSRRRRIQRAFQATNPRSGRYPICSR